MKKIIIMFAIALIASVSFTKAQILMNSHNGANLSETETKGEPNATKADYVLTYLGNESAFTYLGNTNYGEGTYYGSGCINFTASQIINYVTGKISQISVYFGSSNYMTGCTQGKVWIKNSLTGVVAYEQDFLVTEASWNDVVLNNPFIITDDDLVIGFTAIHVLYGSNNTIRPLTLSTLANDPYKPGGCNYRISTDPNNYGQGANWLQYTAAGNLTIKAYVIDAPALPDNDLRVNALTTDLTEFQVINAEYSYFVEVENSGLLSQNNYTVQILDEANNILASKELTTALASGDRQIIEFNITHETAKEINLKGKVILAGDQVGANDESSPQTLRIYPMTPIAYCDRTLTSNVYWLNPTIKKWYAAKFPKEDIQSYVGKFITGIEVGVRDKDLVEYLRPWVAMGEFDPEDPYFGFPEFEAEFELEWILDPVTPKTGWNYYPINPPIEITNTNLILGYEAAALASFAWGVSRNKPNHNNGTWITNPGWVNYWEKYPETSGNHAIIATIENEPPRICNPITDFTAKWKTEEGQCINVELTWTEPEDEENVKYTIRRGTTIIAENISGTSFTDTEPLHGVSNSYSITFMCDAIVTTPVNATAPVCVGINEVVKIDFSIRPNPAQDAIFITSEAKLNKIEIINFLGQTIISQIDNEKSTRIDISNLSNGVYFVRAISDEGANVKKFVKK